jgi:hypothetical protein
MPGSRSHPQSKPVKTAMRSFNLYWRLIHSTLKMLRKFSCRGTRIPPQGGNNALTGHGSKVAIPPVTQRLDYEAELAIVIGKEACYVTKEAALDNVFGYYCK